MPTYAFHARALDGRKVQGERSAGSEAELGKALAAEGLFLVKAQPAEARSRAKLGGPKLKRKELVAFLVHLGSYVEAGVPLLSALVDYRVPDNPSVDAAIRDLMRRIEGGSTLSEAMEAYPTLFSNLQVSMIRSGEGIGRLDESIREVVRLVEWEEEFASQVKSASTYPLVVLGLVAVVIVIVMVFSLPVIMKLMTELNVPLPLPTRIFLGLGQAFLDWGWAVLVLLGLGLVAFRFSLRKPEVRLWWDTRILHLPLIGSLATRLGLSRFATFFAAQYRAGIPILQLLKECQAVTGNARLGLCVRRIREGVEAGERMAVMAASVGYFPPLVVRMLAIGEEAGNLEETLNKVSAYFDAEVKAAIKRFFQLLEPLLLLVLAGVIVFVAVSILLPIYTLIGSVNAQTH